MKTTAPKKFIKRRNGKSIEFDRQIYIWRKYKKSKGALKDSHRKGEFSQYMARKATKNIFE